MRLNFFVSIIMSQVIERQRVVITGIGTVTSYGDGVEALWNNRYIDHVQITVAETVGVGNRAQYYNKYGAMRDMLQNHMLQL